MVLEIRLRNLFSIKEEIVLDFRAGNINTQKSKALKHNVFDFKKSKVLKTIALYGANASGKSNIIRAISFCNAMVFASHQHNENTVFAFKPFKFNGYPNKPSTYFIRFVSNNIEYAYSFSLTQTEIITESLHYYPKGRIVKIFTRDERHGKSKKEIYSFGSVIKRPMDVAENTSHKTLYISRASQMDRIVGKEIFKYFSETFVLGYQGFNARSVDILFEENRNLILQALKIADSDIIDIQKRKELKKGKSFKADFKTNKTSVEDIEEEYLKFITYHKLSPKIPFDFNSEESKGTQKLFFIILTILDIVKNNKILIIDEIESSLHTYIIEYIIEVFNASKQAQLIYSTHNTKLLNLNKLRKDQIFFVNKKDDASTDLYSLFDYNDFRDTMDVEKAYLQGRFDAVPFIDDSIENIKSIING